MADIRAERALFWIPRMAVMLFALFLSVFALDVFDAATGVADTTMALLVHLIPTFLVLLALWLAWHREALGGWLFIALGAAYCLMAWGRFPLVTYAIVAGPPVVIGVMFLAHHQLVHRARPA